MIDEDMKRQAIKFVRDHPLGTLGMLDTHGKPWGTAVYFGADNHFNLYFTTKTGTAKYTYLQSHPYVSGVFVHEAKQETLQIQGEVFIADSSSQNSEVEEALRRIAPMTEDLALPIIKLKEGGYELYKVVVNYAKLTWYGNKKQGEIPISAEYHSDQQDTTTIL